MGPSLDRALKAAVLFGLASVLGGALHDAPRAWDVGYYHWPLAARLAGVLTPDTFVLSPANESRLAGFPLLGELMQGILWRVTGRAECANLVAFASVPLFAWFMQRRFAVPWALTVVGLFAVPLVHTHAASSYVDLPANTALAVVVMLAIDAWATPAPPSANDVALALVAAAIAVNVKALLHLLVALGLVAILARFLPALARAMRISASPKSAPPQVRARVLKRALLVGAVLPIVFATPLKNLAVHGNPYFPIKMSVLGHRFPGLEDPYDSSPRWLESAPRPVRFACSLAEVGLRPMTNTRRWTVDQWMPSDAPGFRMGGFFHAYVAALLALFVWRVAREGRQRAQGTRAAAWGFATFTAAVSVMPQSHELRYYMGWMIVLVAVNLRLACARAPDSPAPDSRVRDQRVLGAVSACALAVVLWVTRGAYAYPGGTSFADLVREQVGDGLATVQSGERICVVRPPWTLAWAAPFNPPRGYVVQEADSAEECHGWRQP